MTTYLSKKDLEKLFGLADTTVYRTLKVCGLSTKRRAYSEDEIRMRFIPARKLYEAGYKTTQIKEYFELKPVHYVYQERPRRTVRYKP